MIALNELLQNTEKFSKAYKLMGLNVNLKTIVDLENKRKKIQLEYEDLRAQSNKLCSQTALIKKSGKDVASHINEIEKIDSKITSLDLQLKLFEKKINSKLKLLHNLPDFNNEINEQIETSGKESSFNEFSSFLKSMMPSKPSIRSAKHCIKKLKNRMFEQSELPNCTFARNGIVILLTENETNKMIDKILNYFKSNCMNIVRLSVNNLEKSSSSEYLVQINKYKHLKMKVKREFFTREYKIKYKNSSLDMTKFVNQINIKYL